MYTYTVVKLMAGFWMCGPIWLIGSSRAVQRTPTGLTKLLPTRPADSETLSF